MNNRIINGKEIYKFDNLQVFEIEGGNYLLTDGGEVPVLFETMPLLDATFLRSQLPKIAQLDNYEVFQLTKNGNVLRPITKAITNSIDTNFNSWYNNQVELQEFSTLGY